MVNRIISIVFVLGIFLVFANTGNANSVMKHESGAEMKMHHIHIMMNHGLKMVTEWSNMVMFSDMKMAPGVDKTAHNHGHSMIEKRKAVINRTLNSPEMMSMIKGEHVEFPMMQDTHTLGNHMLKVTGMLEEMSKAGPIKPDMMAMHHHHIMINHALGMALQGSNMKMLGDISMAGSADNFSLEHGKIMMKNARALLTGVMEDKTMMDMHKGEMSPEKDPMMMKTHILTESAMKIMDELSKM
jgi:hypothetical protein